MITVHKQKQGGKCETIDLSQISSWDKKSDETIWVDLWNTPNSEIESILNEKFGLHELNIEDVLRYNESKENVQLPKIDDFGEYLFLIFNGFTVKGKTYNVFSLNAFVGNNFIITIHNEEGTNFVVSSVDTYQKDTLLTKGPDYILHLILDHLVDNYYPMLEILDEKIDTIENNVFEKDSSKKTLQTILKFKRELLYIRRISTYQKEILFKAYRGDFEVIDKKESMYYRNVYDHLVRVADTTESYRDVVTGLLDSYLSIVNNKMNEIMKILTVIATIILPLNLITGIFGMNFSKNFPLLDNEYGFWISMGIMLMISLVMLNFFRKKGWLSKDN
ncbi:magnesium/cobalt transporter CorA [soil metagenome]